MTGKEGGGGEGGRGLGGGDLKTRKLLSMLVYEVMCALKWRNIQTRSNDKGQDGALRPEHQSKTRKRRGRCRNRRGREMGTKEEEALSTGFIHPNLHLSRCQYSHLPYDKGQDVVEGSVSVIF